MSRTFLLFLNIFALCSLAEASPSINFSPLEREEVGIVVHSVSTGKNVITINSEKTFSYASNVKLLTSAAALHHLGRNFHFSTKFLFRDDTLFIKTDGNPSTVMEELWWIANDLRSRGVGRVSQVVTDDFAYGKEGERKMQGGEIGDRAYLAPISPLSLNFNAVKISVAPGKKGKAPEVGVGTPGDHFLIDNRARTVDGRKRNLLAHTLLKGNKTVVQISGTIGTSSKPQTFYRKIFKPTFHYIRTLLHLLGKSGDIPIFRKNLSPNLFTSSSGILLLHQSRDLRNILTSMNRYSSNFIAESLLSFLGRKVKGNPEKGVDVLREFALSISGKTPQITNGSGLGKENLLKPTFLISLLKYEYRDPFERIDFFSALPVAGEDGTLKGERGRHISSVRAKTGTLSGVSSISGLMRGKSGKLYLFTIVINSKKSKVSLQGVRSKILQQIYSNL